MPDISLPTSPPGRGWIRADEHMRTSLPGVYAVGDVRTKAFRQVVTAVGDGATAAYYADEYLTQIAQAQEDSALDR